MKDGAPCKDGIISKTMEYISDHVAAPLTHWGRVTHICVGKLTIIGSDNGLSPGRRQAIIWTNVGILLIRPLETNFNEIQIEIHAFSSKKMHLKLSSAKWQPLCLGLNVLTRFTNLSFSHAVFPSELKLLWCHLYTKQKIQWSSVSIGQFLCSHFFFKNIRETDV